MRNLVRLTDTQMARLHPFFPKGHSRPSVDDCLALTGMIFISRNAPRQVPEGLSLRRSTRRNCHVMAMTEERVLTLDIA